MNLLKSALAGLALAFAGVSPARTPAIETSLQQALDRGNLLYAYDRAAWNGTDDLRAKAKAIIGQVGGWIVDGPASAPELVFYDKSEADPQILYAARFRGTKLVSSRLLGPADDRTLSAERKRLIAAKRVAVPALVRSKASRCVDKSFNTVVLPPAAPADPVLVYFLTPQTQQNAFPFGGHYRVDVPASGEPAVRPFAKSCLAMAVPAGPAKPEAMVVSHLLDPVPTEIHVFSSLAAGLPVAVVTSDKRVWMVEGSRRVRLLKSNGRS